MMSEHERLKGKQGQMLEKGSDFVGLFTKMPFDWLTLDSDKDFLCNRWKVWKFYGHVDLVLIYKYIWLTYGFGYFSEKSFQTID